jgi:glycosyltransferase involved in cell wall biosynthesis
MHRGKGLLLMVEAVAQLVKEGQPVVLDLVGAAEKGDNILDEINHFSTKEGISDHIIYHGFQPLGSDLFRFYKEADLYLLASTASEGFPRTIWEAMAHCLPVIATRVGSIPDFLEQAEAAMLIPAHDTNALVDAIRKLLSDSRLRKRLIENAFSLAQANTLEVRAQEIINNFKTWLA